MSDPDLKSLVIDFVYQRYNKFLFGSGFCFFQGSVPDSTLDRVLNPVEDPDPKMYVIRMTGEPYCYPSCGSDS